MLGKIDAEPPKSYKKECQEQSPSARCRPIFCLGIQPNCLNVHSCSGSGSSPGEGFSFVSACEPENQLFSPVVPLRYSDGAPIVFLKRNKPDDCPLKEWQCMVLSETLRLWLSLIVREGIGWL